MRLCDRDPLIAFFDDALTEDQCDRLIDKFEKDHRKQQGVVGRGVDLDTKQSIDLYITDLENWEEEDDFLFQSLTPRLNEYIHSSSWLPDTELTLEGLYDTGYQIQRTEPGGFYTWHHDSNLCWHEDHSRMMTYLWYLNDVPDGYTEFKNGVKVKPERGKLMLFPATWTYFHRGNPPSETKYICTGWLCVRNKYIEN